MAIKVPKSEADWRLRRRVLVPALGAAVRSITRVRRWSGPALNRLSGPALDRLQLRLIVWRTALDPETAVWIEQAKRSVADGSAMAQAWTADDLRRMAEERRKLIQ